MKILKILLNATLMISMFMGMCCGSRVSQADTSLTLPTLPEVNNLQTLKAKLKTAKVVFAFNFNGNNGNSANVECESLFLAGQLCASATNKKQLNPAQIQILIDMTTDSTNYHLTWSGSKGICFVPHIGFAFFRGDSLIGQVNLCFLCGDIRTVPQYNSDGLTNLGAQRFQQFAQTLGLKIVNASNATF